jgi:hypothetical protein
MLRVCDDSIQTTFYSIDEDCFRQIYGLLMNFPFHRCWLIFSTIGKFAALKCVAPLRLNNFKVGAIYNFNLLVYY